MTSQNAPTPSGSPVRLQEPQAVLTPLTAAALFLVVTIEPGEEGVVRDLLADLAGLERTVGFRVPTAGLALVAGIGSDAWDRLFAGPRPAELHQFEALHGDRHSAPATPGDLLFHIRAAQHDLCFELASQIMDRLAGSVTVVELKAPAAGAISGAQILYLWRRCSTRKPALPLRPTLRR